MAHGRVGKLSEERMGEIALLYIRNKVRKESIRLDHQELRRQSGTTAKELDIEMEEALQFLSTILFDAFNDVIEGLDKK